MKLFGYRGIAHRLAALEASVKDIETRLTQVENETAPLRVGEFNRYELYTLYHSDYRPKVTLRDALQHVITHLKLRFEATPAAPVRIELKKRP